MNNKFTLRLGGFIAAFLLSFVSLNKAQAQTYCTPVYGSVACIAGMTLTNVTLAGESVTLNNTTTCSANGYGDYTAMNKPNLMQGQSYSISVSTTYAIPDYCNVRIWIDYNNDGTFSSSEEIASSNGNGIALSGTSTYSFTVPFSAAIGAHRMRVRLVYAGAAAIDPCTLENFGEAEDYQIEVISSASACSGQPSAGVISGLDTVSVCTNANLNLVVTGATDASGMTYQWQERVPAGTGNWTNITGATSFTLNRSGATLPNSSQYRFVVNCTNGNLKDTSNVIAAIINQVATECYCIPEGTNATRYINDFSTSNGVTNISNLTTGFSPNGYGNFTSKIVEQYIGQDFNFSTNFKGGNYGFKVWVDWNQDGVFDTSEVAYQSTSFDSTLLGTVSIPSTALLGATRMRIGITTMSLAGPATPCETNYSFGEFEDYSVVVLSQLPCTGTPDAGTLPTTVAVCSGQSFNLIATGATSSVSVSGLVGQWQFRLPAGTGVWEDVIGATTPSESMLMPGSPIDIRFIYSCGSNSDTSNLMTTTINPANECYCIPEGNNPNRYVDSFSTTLGIQNITNLNSGFSANGFEIFTADTAIQQRGHTIQFSASIHGGTAGVKVWVDWNRDGSFNGPSELVYQSSGHATTHTGTITVPHFAVEGPTRIRIGSNWSVSSGPATPCETNYTQGEYEDYIFKIEACDAPFLSLTQDTLICEGTSLTLSTGNTDSGIATLWSESSTSESIIVNTGGAYYVKVSDIYGCSNYDTVIVSIDPLPSADNIAVTWLADGSNSFAAVGVQNSDTYLWNFGDGQTSQDANPNHTFANDGNYQITLIITNDCGDDTLTTTINYTTGINHLKLGKDQFQVYPNPARDHLTFQNSSDYKMSTITVYNMLGQKVFQGNAQSATQHKLNVGAYASGIYTAYISFEGGKGMTQQFEVLR